MIQYLYMTRAFIVRTSICIAIIFLLAPLFLFAQGLRPFGGRVITVKTPPTVQCGTNLASPFMIAPAGASLPGPWSALPGPVNVGQIVPNAWILGLIFPGPGTCVSGTPPSPFPTTTTNFYGTSFGAFNLPI